jgi:hypothetical protein
MQASSSSREGSRGDPGGYRRLQQVAGGDRWDTRGIQGDTQRERRTRIHEGYRRIQRIQGSQQVPGCNLEVSGSGEVPVERASASSVGDGIQEDTEVSGDGRG